jgi:prophage regulatory protein
MVKLLSDKDLLTIKGINYSSSQRYRKIREGTFPRPVKIGENKNAWLEVEVDAWIESRIAARDTLDKASAIQAAATAKEVQSILRKDGHK